MDKRIKVQSIVPIRWSDYKFMVHVESLWGNKDGKKFCRSYDEQDYVEETLKKWFGDIRWYWNTNSCWVYLCELKVR